MTTHLGLVIAVMMAMALGHDQQGCPAQMRSLVQPIPATGQPPASFTPAPIDRAKTPEETARLSFRMGRNDSNLTEFQGLGCCRCWVSFLNPAYGDTFNVAPA